MCLGLHVILFMHRYSSLEPSSYRSSSSIDVCVKISVKSFTIGIFAEITSKSAKTFSAWVHHKDHGGISSKIHLALMLRQICDISISIICINGH
jgi:hypothetical protein